MARRAIRVSNDPVGYFVSPDVDTGLLRIADVVLRVNKNPRVIFSRLIRLATQSPFSHSALIYLVSDPQQGFDNTFLVEAVTKGIRVTSWRNELSPFTRYSVAIKRPPVDWYVETPTERADRNPRDPKDMAGIGYLRHVRGLALDQINGLYDHAAVQELMGLYAERIATRYLSHVPAVADAISSVVKHLEAKDQPKVPDAVLRFICSGLVQYSFFEALRRRIQRGMAEPGGRDAASSNLRHMGRMLFRDDPEGLVDRYVRDVESGKRDIAAPFPDPLLGLLKTATPADFAGSPNLEWRYVILEGAVWQIEQAEAGYGAQSEDEASVLKLVGPHAVVAEADGAEADGDESRNIPAASGMP